MRTLADNPATWPSGSPQFQTTQWSLVLTATREGVAQSGALEQLCRAYWYPLYAYIRRRGNAAPDAQDLTQEFFARLLEKNWLSDIQPNTGRFRSFLLTAVNRFLANEYDRARAAKRGGGAQPFSLDQAEAEERYAMEPADLETPERIFDRRWALTVLDQALNRLRTEVLAAGKGRQFELFSPFLSREAEPGEYSSLAQKLELTPGAVGVAVHRLRQRYREILRVEVAGTVSDVAQVDVELQSLFSALSS